MGAVQRRPLSDEEKKITEKNLATQEYNTAVMRLQEKKILLQLEELPFVKKKYEDALVQVRYELRTLQQAVDDAKKTLEK